MSLSVEFEDAAKRDLSPAEQLALERALAQALAPLASTAAEPAPKFVARLGQQLSEAARRDSEAQKRRGQRLRTAGLVGGLASVVGGLVVWLLWRQHRRGGEAPAGAEPVAAWGMKPLPRAHHALRS